MSLRPAHMMSAAVVCWLSGCLDGTPADGGPGPQCDVAVGEQALYSGSPEPATLSLDERARLALVTVHPETAQGDGLCTGTLIDDAWILTAAHCAGSAVAVRFGPELQTPDLSLQIHDLWVHAELDVALLRLPSTQLVARLGASPIPLWSDAVPDTWLGTQLELAGRGLTEDGSVGTLLFVAETVTDITPETVEVDGMGDSGACVGDSGGPLLVTDDAGNPRVAGTLSEGAASCTGRDLYVRADRMWAWVAATMRDNPAPDLDPCTLHLGQ